MKMHCSLIILAGVTAAVSLPRSPSVRVSQESEPPLSIRVSGLGEERVLASGDSFEVTLGGETRTVTVESLSSRRLCIPEVCFEYPANFGFEYDPSGGARTWTLDGNDATIIVQASPAATTTRFFAESMAEGFADLGDGEVEWVAATPIVVEGLRIDSLRFIVPWNQLEFRVDVHGILRGEGDKRSQTFLIVQEVADQGDDPAPEIEEVRALIESTLMRLD